MGSRYQLALEEARRSYDAQLAQLENLRSRGTWTVAAGALALSVIGVDTKGAGCWSYAWSILAFLCFATVVIGTVVIAWPQKVWAGQKPHLLVQWVELDDASTDDQIRDLALHLEQQSEANAKVIDRLQKWHGTVLIALLVEVPFLLLGKLWEGVNQ
ncbi:hypothetical protein [Nocardioides panzhihuensis]|uniref:Uncharacterized protein n=1 Tax=Nocardioides panzhihuensis TaxID=860243 RepID=A0A7Z0DT46_9ACTN|nr:hypothetical protein [Nocardioides panzhihuensis]NYI81197.1 hypothetical protein [Nocardioides panzhihuensis]